MIKRLTNQPWLLLASVLLVAAVASGVVAALTWSDFAIEGAYLNSSSGKVAFSGVYSDATGGRIWLGLAIGLAVAGALVLALSVWQKRNSSAGPPRP